MCGGSAFSLSHTVFPVGETYFLLIMHRACVYATIADCEGCVGFIVEKGPLLSNIAGVSELWDDMLFHHEPCVLWFSSVCYFSIVLLAASFSLMHRLGVRSFPIFGGLCKFSSDCSGDSVL